MAEYKYQMHCHTTPCSACGRITPNNLIHTLRDNGFAGAVLTNHFYNGNTGIDKSLPWKKFVSLYEKDYYDCKRLADSFGIDILFGVEENIGNGQEILCYGLTPEMLYAHPELKEGKLELWYNTLSPLGVLIIQAHPFRHRNFSSTGVRPLEYLDGIEMLNSANSPEENEDAVSFAQSHGELITTSGADAHLPYQLMKGGIISDIRIKNEALLVQVLKSGAFRFNLE